MYLFLLKSPEGCIYFYRGNPFCFNLCHFANKLSIIRVPSIKIDSFLGNENSDLDSWGDPYSNAEAQGFRRCCARFGLGLHLWEK